MIEKTNTNILEEPLCIRYSDIDMNGYVKPSSLFNFFQDIATDSAEKLGFGYSYLYPKDLIWVLLKYRIEFSRYPSRIKNLRLITEPRGYHRLFAYRNFELLESNTSLLKASSLWGLLNFKTMNMVNVESVLSESGSLKKYIPNEKDLSFGKITNLTRIDFEEEFKVRYNDLDINMHANNSNYITWGLEPLAYEFRKEHELKNIDMLFKKEIKPATTFKVQVQLQDKTSLHVIKSLEDEDLCLIKCEWI